MLTISLNCIKRTLTNFLTFIVIFTKSLLFSHNSAAACVNFIKGEAIQGGLIFYDSSHATEINLDGEPIIVNKENGFVVGFHRDDLAMRTIEGLCKDGSPFSFEIQPSKRHYKIQKIDGLAPEMVTPPTHVLEQIANDFKMVKKARSIRGNSTDYFTNGFNWPVYGTITSIYGDQRILNGKPRQPHFGIDIAAPLGEPVAATASGHVVMAEKLYFTGWTVIISHGDYISSTYSHLNTISVKTGENIKRGEKIGTVGSTGRSTGPHLDWRINLLDRRLDPLILVKIDNINTTY